MNPKITPSPKQVEILFQPLTEGLGFHPFSDGLPYAPMTKNPRMNGNYAAPGGQASRFSNGSGAVSGGPPKIAVDLLRAQKKSPSHPTEGLQISVPVVKKETVHSVLALQSPKNEERSRYGYIYLFRRCFAFLTDCSVNLVIFLGMTRLFFGAKEISLDMFSNLGVLLLIGANFVLFQWLSMTFQEVTLSTTFGKRLFRLRLLGGPLRRLLRAVFFIPSVGCLGTGLLYSLVDSQKRCWHDRIFDLQPVEKK